MNNKKMRIDIFGKFELMKSDLHQLTQFANN